MNNDERVKHPELFAEVLYGWSIFNLDAAAADSICRQHASEDGGNDE